MSPRLLLPAALLTAWAFPTPVTSPWEHPRVPADAPAPQGVGTFSAAQCGACHPDIAREWAASTHAHAWTDRQFQAERAKDPPVAWLCDNCHTPLGRQQPERTVSTGDPRSPLRAANPSFEPSLQPEGITCLTCHWRPEGIAGLHANPASPHAVVVDPGLRSERTCTVCHQAVAQVGDTLVCSFNTGEEWRSAAPGKTCPECHMQRITRPVAVGGPPREGGRHLWPGGLVPKEPFTPEEAALFADWKPGVALSIGPPGQGTGTPGAQVVVPIHLRHQGAGHRVPTGDPERYLQLEVVATDATGAELARTSHRVGQTWTWWPKAVRTGDNRLSPGEDRVVPLTFTRRPGGGPVTIAATLDHVRISPENAQHHKLDGYPTQRRVASESLRLD